MNKLNKLSLVIPLFLILSALGVSAFAITSSYWSTNPMLMASGETKDTFFGLQNCPALLESCDPTDLKVVVIPLEGTEISTFITGTEYTIPFGTDNTYIDLQVSIPKCTPIDTSYNISFLVVPLDTNGQMLNIGYNINFPVIVTSADIPALKCKKNGKDKIIR